MKTVDVLETPYNIFLQALLFLRRHLRLLRPQLIPQLLAPRLFLRLGDGHYFGDICVHRRGSGLTVLLPALVLALARRVFRHCRLN